MQCDQLSLSPTPRTTPHEFIYTGPVSQHKQPLFLSSSCQVCCHGDRKTNQDSGCTLKWTENKNYRHKTCSDLTFNWWISLLCYILFLLQIYIKMILLHLHSQKELWSPSFLLMKTVSWHYFPKNLYSKMLKGLK